MTLAGFWSKTAWDGACLVWTGTRAVNGYGITFRDKRRLYAHRIAWEYANGRPVPAGLHVLHACDNPPCVNPAHLRVGTAVDNLRDMMSRGRGRRQMPRGHANPNSKLTEADVRAIRAALKAGESQAAVAERFAVRPQSIYAIEIGKSWAWLRD